MTLMLGKFANNQIIPEGLKYVDKKMSRTEDFFFKTNNVVIFLIIKTIGLCNISCNFLNFRLI